MKYLSTFAKLHFHFSNNQQHNLKKEIDLMKNKLKETMTTNEQQDEELRVLRAQNADCTTVIKEKVKLVSFLLRNEKG